MYFRQDGDGNGWAIPHTIIQSEGEMLTSEQQEINTEYLLRAQQYATVAGDMPNIDVMTGPVALRREGVLSYEALTPRPKPQEH